MKVFSKTDSIWYIENACYQIFGLLTTSVGHDDEAVFV